MLKYREETRVDNRSLLRSTERSLQQLLERMEAQNCSDYEEESDFLTEISQWEALLTEIKAELTRSETNDRKNPGETACLPKEAKRNARIREMLLRIQTVNNQTIAAAGERLAGCKDRMEDLRKTKTGMSAYLKSGISLRKNQFNQIG